jgi:hypothetical protein
VWCGAQDLRVKTSAVLANMCGCICEWGMRAPCVVKKSNWGCRVGFGLVSLCNCIEARLIDRDWVQGLGEVAGAG